MKKILFLQILIFLCIEAQAGFAQSLARGEVCKNDLQSENFDNCISGGKKVVERKSANLESPTSGVALLKNIKIVVDERLLLRRDTFSDGGMKWIFGEDYAVQPRDNESVTGDYLSFRLDAAPSSFCINSGNFQWFRKETSDGRERVAGSFSAGTKFSQQNGQAGEGCQDLTADSVVDVFGRPGKVIDKEVGQGKLPSPHLPAPETGFGPKSHPMGHSELVYEFSDQAGKPEGRVRFLVSGSGNIVFINVENWRE
ncbi:hypothetical protein ACQZ3V_01820 [Ralstonia pseudosolanacearum]|uniref:hypothetical protein n=1 Tax=Ralstonia pseudosolanacearum TaxID=1310165 RepID=UPI001FFB4799